MGLKLTNNAISRIASGITASSTSISLVPGEGALFPTLGAGDYFPATLVKADGSYEIVRVTARSSDVLTVTRAQEGTTAKSFSASDRIELRLTAAIVEALENGKLSNSGGTMTGDLTMGAGTKIVMEGTADDASEVTIDPGNPTADRTLTLPDKSGTLATTGDVFGTSNLADSAVTYAKIQNVTAGKVLGRDTSGNGVVQELPIAVTSSGQLLLGTTSASGSQVDIVDATGNNNRPLTIARSAVNAATKSCAISIRHWLNAEEPVALIGAGIDDNTSNIVRIGGGFSNLNAATIISFLTAANNSTVGGTECGQFDSSGNFKFNSGYGSAATAYGCRAWVKFNGTGTIAINGSGNVSSITDNGGTYGGNYTVNFTTAMPDANYCVSGSASRNDGNGPFTMGPTSTTTYTASAVQINTMSDGGTVGDSPRVSVAIFR